MKAGRIFNFIFLWKTERDDGNKENQPELADKRQKLNSPAKHKQRIRHESEGKYEQDFKWLMAHCNSRRILVLVSLFLNVVFTVDIQLNPLSHSEIERTI
jgi:hypothetical protein